MAVDVAAPAYRSRAARWEDVSEIAEIERLSFPVPWRREYFEAELGEPNRYHRVLESLRGESPRIGGYLFAMAAPGLAHPAEIHVNKIATHPALRRRGLGRYLMAELLAQAQRWGTETITLEVRVSNTAAIRFYEGFSFTEGYRRRRYYLDGEDAIVMTRSFLDPSGTRR